METTRITRKPTQLFSTDIVMTKPTGWQHEGGAIVKRYSYGNRVSRKVHARFCSRIGWGDLFYLGN